MIERIQHHLSALETAMLYRMPVSSEELSELAGRIEEVREEIDRLRISLDKIKNPAEKKAKSNYATAFDQQLEALILRIASITPLPTTVTQEGYIPKNPQFAAMLKESEHPATPLGEEGLAAVQDARGISLASDGASANPVAILAKQNFLLIDQFKKDLESSDLKPIEQISETVSSYEDHLSSLLPECPAWFQSLGHSFLKKVPSINAPYNKEHFEAFIVHHFTEKKEKHAGYAKYYDHQMEMALHIVNSGYARRKEEKARLFLGLLQNVRDESVVRYDIRDLRKLMLLDFKAQLKEHRYSDLDTEMTAMHLLLAGVKSHLGLHLTKKETMKLVHEFNEALKTTYGFVLKKADLMENCPLYINTSALYEMCKNVPEMKGVIDRFQPQAKEAVVKGGSESLREMMLIKLAAAFNLDQNLVKKELVEDANIAVKGDQIQTAVVSPYIPTLKDSEYLKIWHEAIESRDMKELEKLRAIITPESYGESLYLSLLFYGTDDHYNQFTVVDKRLVNFDPGRDLPPARFIFYDMKLEILLRSALIEYPQFEDPLHPTVVEKIAVLTPEKVEEVLAPYRISAFTDPYQTRRLLHALQKNPHLSEQEQKKFLESLAPVSNLPTVNKVTAFFKGELDSSLIPQLLAKAEEGCRYHRNLAIYHSEMYRDFHHLSILDNPPMLEKLNALLKFKGIPFEKACASLFEGLINEIPASDPLHQALENHNLVTEYLNDAGTTLAEAQKYIPRMERDKIDAQITRLIKTSVSEETIERMKEGQRKLLAKIGAGKGLTGRELAKTLYPEEIRFYEACKDYGDILPALNSLGWKKREVLSLVDWLDNNPHPKFDRARIDQLIADAWKMYNEAGNLDSYYRFCYNI